MCNTTVWDVHMCTALSHIFQYLHPLIMQQFLIILNYFHSSVAPQILTSES